MRSATQNNDTNNQLINQVLIGNQIAITKFYYQVIGIIKSIIRKSTYSLQTEVIDELAHDIFVDKVYYKLGKYNPQKSQGIVTYIHSIVKNHLIDLYRSSNKSNTQSLDLMFENNSFNFYTNNLRLHNSPEELMIKKQEQKKLNKILGQLSEYNRKILEGFYFENKSLRELAFENNTSVNSISIRLLRAKQKLKKLY